MSEQTPTTDTTEVTDRFKLLLSTRYAEVFAQVETLKKDMNKAISRYRAAERDLGKIATELANQYQLKFPITATPPTPTNPGGSNA